MNTISGKNSDPQLYLGNALKQHAMTFINASEYKKAVYSRALKMF
jgi:hypothetical protein